MTREEIEEKVASKLNRTDMTNAIQTWFEIAHLDLQRTFNRFTGSEDTLEFTLSENSHTRTHAVPSTFKEPKIAYLYNPDTEKVEKFYNKTNIESLRERRIKTDPTLDVNIIANTFETYQYAIWDGYFELWPNIEDDLVDKEFRVDCYVYASPPESSGEDWLCIRAWDALFYRILQESCTHLGLSGNLKDEWEKLADRSMNRVIAMDISRDMSGPLRVRG